MPGLLEALGMIGGSAVEGAGRGWAVKLKADAEKEREENLIRLKDVYAQKAEGRMEGAAIAAEGRAETSKEKWFTKGKTAQIESEGRQFSRDLVGKQMDADERAVEFDRNLEKTLAVQKQIAGLPTDKQKDYEYLEKNIGKEAAKEYLPFIVGGGVKETELQKLKLDAYDKKFKQLSGGMMVDPDDPSYAKWDKASRAFATEFIGMLKGSKVEGGQKGSGKVDYIGDAINKINSLGGKNKSSPQPTAPEPAQKKGLLESGPSKDDQVKEVLSTKYGIAYDDKKMKEAVSFVKDLFGFTLGEPIEVIKQALEKNNKQLDDFFGKSSKAPPPPSVSASGERRYPVPKR